MKIPFYLLCVRNIHLHLFIKQIINFSVKETLFLWTCWIYSGSRPYKEDYQVLRISHKGYPGHLPSPLAKFSSVPTFKIFRVISSNEPHARIARHKRILDFCMTWKKDCPPNHLLAFWRRPHVRDNVSIQFVEMFSIAKKVC